MSYNYPFAAIVGQTSMKLALLLNAVMPQLGGVLIQGEKGTAKSTAVRSLADLLPVQEAVADCPFGCDPADDAHLCNDCRQRKRTGTLGKTVRRQSRVVELPVSATEDRVVGTLDLAAALETGEMKFEPGLLAEANRNILYVDEVNLLEDHIVDVLLDAAAMGVNTVEREGVSFRHPARFVLVGTMNPEEGDLRPQLIDRFGVSVTVHGEQNPETRAEVIRRRLAFEADPTGFCAAWEPEQEILRRAVTAARERLSSVVLPDAVVDLAVRICIDAGAEGHRADITLCKAAEALAAWNGEQTVTADDVVQSAALALPHRMRHRPFEEPRLDMDHVRALAHVSLQAEENQ